MNPSNRLLKNIFRMKHLLLLSFIILFTASFQFKLKAQDTLRIFSHRNEVIVTDPSEGIKHHPHWTVFPDENTPIRQILMYAHFACPDTMRCADWDYLDRIMLVKQSDNKQDTLNLELGKLITPYGGFFKSDWAFTWEMDLTDFRLYLHDSVLIDYIHSGYEPNHDRGWKLNLEFAFITGTPAAKPVKIHTIYNGRYEYGNPDNPIDQLLAPISFQTSPTTTHARLRILQTGHGMDLPDNCAEFCSKYREIWYNGELISTRNLWKKCGDNPVFPQAGTWIFDRANWCPGDLLPGEFFTLPLKEASNHTVQFRMEPYEATEINQGAQMISAYVIEYEQPIHSLDAHLSDIHRPSDKDIHSRINPALSNATISIINRGSEPITALTIRYGTIGFETNAYQWQGLIQPFDKDTIVLPGIIDTNPSNNRFFAEVSRVNGQKDPYPLDNRKEIAFTPAPVHQASLIFKLRTNREPEQNQWTLTRLETQEVLHRSDSVLEAEKTYLDTFQLQTGAYQLEFTDAGGDGLEFWFNAAGGRGEAILLNAEGSLLHAFESDCGSGWAYAFTISENAPPIDSSLLATSMYPGRTSDSVKWRYLGNAPGNLLVQLSDESGNILEEHRYPNVSEKNISFSLLPYAYGRFRFQVFRNDSLILRKRIRFVPPDSSSEPAYVPPSDPAVKAKLETWQDWKFGAIIHWGTYSAWGIVESWSLAPEDEPWCERKGPYAEDYNTYVQEYEKLPESFYPEKFNPENWAKACREAGMKYLIFTTKHHDGFSMFDSKQTDYTISNPRSKFSKHPRNNISLDVFNAFREEGLAVGAYFSKADWHHNDYWWPYFPPTDRNVNYDPKKYPEKWERFKDFTHRQIDELMSDYGPLDILWLDGGWVRPEGSLTEETRPWLGKNQWIQDIDMERIAANARSKQEGILLVDRTVHGPFENYRTPEQQIPEEIPPYPWESCITLGSGWYSSGPDDPVKSLHWAVHTLVQIVAKGGNLLLGIGPDKTGALQPNVLKRLEEIGSWVSQHEEAIYATRPLAPYQVESFALTQSKDEQHAYLFYLMEEDQTLPKKLYIPEGVDLSFHETQCLLTKEIIPSAEDKNGKYLAISKQLQKKSKGVPAIVFKVKR